MKTTDRRPAGERRECTRKHIRTNKIWSNEPIYRHRFAQIRRVMTLSMLTHKRKLTTKQANPNNVALIKIFSVQSQFYKRFYSETAKASHSSCVSTQAFTRDQVRGKPFVYLRTHFTTIKVTKSGRRRPATRMLNLTFVAGGKTEQ